jgi:hypothetical protein
MNAPRRLDNRADVGVRRDRNEQRARTVEVRRFENDRVAGISVDHRQTRVPRLLNTTVV